MTGLWRPVRQVGWPEPTRRRHSRPWTRRPEAAGRTHTQAPHPLARRPVARRSKRP